MISPVIQRDSSLARKTVTGAMSSVWAIRPQRRLRDREFFEFATEQAGRLCPLGGDDARARQRADIDDAPAPRRKLRHRRLRRQQQAKHVGVELSAELGLGHRLDRLI